MGWTNPTTRTTGELIDEDDWNVDVVDNLAYLNTELNSGVSQAQPAYTLGTTYQNTTGKVIIVTVSAYNTASGTSTRSLVAYCENDATPDVTVADAVLDGINLAADHDLYQNVTFVVPLTWYYKVSGTNVTLSSWTEWTMH